MHEPCILITIFIEAIYKANDKIMYKERERETINNPTVTI